MTVCRYVLFIFLVTALPSGVFAESDIAGWGKAKWGMTYAEVQKLYELGQWESGDIPISKMKKRVHIMGRNFAVAFYFDERSPEGLLYKVALAHFETSKLDASWVNSIKNILVDKYGNPAIFEVTDRMKTSLWSKSSGRLKLITLTGGTIMCALEYSSTQTESKKL